MLGRLGWSRRRRAGKCARIANEMGMRFSADDPFDLTGRYWGFVLTCAGHSALAENVIYGRCRGWRLRAFDYSFEAGHGQRRLLRRYSVIVADTDLRLPDVLMWNAADNEHIPLTVRRPVGRLGQWLVLTGMNYADVPARAFADFADEPVNIQINRRSVMLCSADRWKPAEFANAIIRTVEGLGKLRKASQAG